MPFFRVHRERGFTLLELVIVLGISGLIFGGLWNLISSGNAQLQAQSAAQQYRQVVEATRRLLSPGIAVGSFDPASYAVDVPADLPLSYMTDSNVGLLSPTFAQGSGNTYYDAFGHQIRVMIEKLDVTDQKWRFMVYSTIPSGLPEISDKAGAQVAALIGSEGGFVYDSDTDGCLSGMAPAAKACGSYNSFAIALSDMGVANGSGRIATLSFTHDTSLIGAPWLMRLTAPPGTDFNTMSADLDFKTGGALNLTMNGSTLNMGDSPAATTGGGALNVNGGEFNMQGGTLNMNIDGSTDGGGLINMAEGNITNLGDLTGGETTMSFSNIDIESSENITFTTGQGISMKESGSVLDPLLDIQGIGRAEEFQAGQFIYTSDMRLKVNPRPIHDALARILKIHGMRYEWKGNKASDVGLLAQDVEKVFPELVSTSPRGTKGIDYGRMIAPVVEAIRQLKEENDALRREIRALQAATH